MEFRCRIRWTVYMLKWTCSVKLGTVGTVNDGMHGKTASLTVLTVCIKRKTVIFDLLSKYSHLLSLFCFSCFLTAHKWMRYVKFFCFFFIFSSVKPEELQFLVDFSLFGFLIGWIAFSFRKVFEDWHFCLCEFLKNKSDLFSKT